MKDQIITVIKELVDKGANTDSTAVLKFSILAASQQIRQILSEEKHFLDLSEKEQEQRNAEDLRDMSIYYGGWDSLREKINDLEEGDFQQAFEARYTPQ